MLVLFAALTAVITYPQIRVIDRGISDLGDPLLVTWAIAWVAHQLPRDPLHLFDANIFHPEPRALAYTEPMIVPGLTAAPILWLGGSPILAYNLLFLSGFVLSGAGTYLLVRSLTNHTGAAVFAGIAFAFHPFRIDHYPHLQLQMTQWMPLALWALHRTVAGGRMRDGLLLGLFITCQALSSMYYGVFLVSYLIPVGLALTIGCAGRRFRKVVWPVVIGAILAGALLLPVARTYMANRELVGERRQGETWAFSAEPRNYLAAPPANVTYGSLTRRFGKAEGHLFPGILVVILAIVAVWPPLSTARIAYLLGLLFAFEASLGFNGKLYSWLYAYLLPYRGLRVPARFGILVGLSLAVLAGYGVARLCSVMPRRWWRNAVVVSLCVVALLEYRATLEQAHVWRKMPSVYGWFRNQPPSVIVELPLPLDPWGVSHEPKYMYFSTEHWHKLVNGFSGFEPPSYRELLRNMRWFPSREAIAYLRQRRVDYLIVHSAFYERLPYEALIDGIGKHDGLTLIGRFPWGRDESRLYRIASP